MNDYVADQDPHANHTRPKTVARGGQPELSAELARIKELDQVRIKELEAANARLLQLVGELLVTNQQLREQSSSTAVRATPGAAE
jgi:hypothetical protein